MKRLLGSVGLFILPIVAPLISAQPLERPPNIVVILIDDLGYGDIGPFGSKSNRTPELDRMAREGMRLTSFYSAPVCCPSRAQLLTGCYAPRVSIAGVILPDDRHGLNPSERTVAEYLRVRNYRTMCIGKWHLGYVTALFPPVHGFDEYFGLPYDRRIRLPLVRGTETVEVLEGDERDTSTERYTREGVRFIAENRTRPFFLYLAHTAVHVPMHPGRRFRGKSANGIYGDWVEEVDWSVGRVLNALRDARLDTNTLVIFTSDNGPWKKYGAEAGETGPLRGSKGSTWEGGVRVPTLAWWPGRVPAGTECDAVAGLIDCLPTFVKLAGGEVEPTPRIDGRDISAVLLGKAKDSPHEAYFYYNNYRLEAVRSGSWKLARRPQGETLETTDQPPPDAVQQPRLYHLNADIGERNDVAASNPEVVGLTWISAPDLKIV